MSCSTSWRASGQVSRRRVRSRQRGQFPVRSEYRRGPLGNLGDRVRSARAAVVRPLRPAQHAADLLGAVLLMSMLAGDLGEPAK
ncbi:hypothetical protein AB0K00_53250 [Dactylosporangium sp. NPDC049525]|uniref:hypothetical protein n=1 Tax=Dactylosporangium sp. NPDC049525 TaxID=3154730 RepID=UPI00342C849D